MSNSFTVGLLIFALGHLSTEAQATVDRSCQEVFRNWSADESLLVELLDSVPMGRQEDSDESLVEWVETVPLAPSKGRSVGFNSSSNLKLPSIVEPADPSRKMAGTYYVDLESPHLNLAVSKITELIQQRIGYPPRLIDPSHLPYARRQIVDLILSEVPRMFESDRRGIALGTYTSGRDQIRTQPRGMSALGEVLLSRNAVCEELALVSHILLSIYGIKSEYMAILVPGYGGHTVLKIGHAVMDLNLLKGIHDLRVYQANTGFSQPPPTFFTRTLFVPKR